jgi:hypothetical protein
MQAGFSDVSWIDSCSDFGESSKDIETYTCGVYFVLTTTSTIGYGDISPKNTIERLFGMILMFTGVLCFTFVSGALASIL